MTIKLAFLYLDFSSFSYSCRKYLIEISLNATLTDILSKIDILLTKSCPGFFIQIPVKKRHFSLDLKIKLFLTDSDKFWNSEKIKFSLTLCVAADFITAKSLSKFSYNCPCSSILCIFLIFHSSIFY